jgi:hypothetical protein
MPSQHEDIIQNSSANTQTTLSRGNRHDHRGGGDCATPDERPADFTGNEQGKVGYPPSVVVTTPT